MSLTMLAVPFENAVPFARPALAAFGLAITALRPFLGLGLLAALLWVFRPLLRGAACAVLILLHARQSITQRATRRSLDNVQMLNRMARELDVQQPNVAAELRLLAARG